MIPLELTPEHESRRQEVLKAGLHTLRAGDSTSKNRHIMKPEMPPPATLAEAGRRASREFRKATTGTPKMIEQRNGSPDAPPIAPPRSHFKGVYPNNSKTKPWYVRISIGGKQRAIGGYPTEEDAARAYDAARVGQGLRPVNFPDEAPAPAQATPKPRVPARPPAAPSRPLSTELLPPGPESALAHELAAAGAIAAALAGLGRDEARRVLAFVGGAYQQGAPDGR